MAAEETPFATAYSLSLASGELTPHGGHVAFSNDLTRPAEIDDTFLIMRTWSTPRGRTCMSSRLFLLRHLLRDGLRVGSRHSHWWSAS